VETLLRALRDELEKICSTKPRFAKPHPAGVEKGVRWAEPRLVCEIECRGWTKDRLLRAAAFKGLRDDRPAIVLEALQKRSKPRVAPASNGIHLTHPERILWEEEGITKQLILRPRRVLSLRPRDARSRCNSYTSFFHFEGEFFAGLYVHDGLHKVARINAARLSHAVSYCLRSPFSSKMERM
jgi:ATP dependent DNA ligase C terminal region